MIRLRGWLALALCVLAAPATGAATRDAERAERFLHHADSLRQAAGIPGLAVVVLRDTTVIAARGFGEANRERGVPVTPDTPFNIASVSKPISAVVALRLAEAGLLDLDRSMRSFRDFADYCANAREQGGLFYGDFACGDTALTLRHVLAMNSNGAPGTRFCYNPVVYSWASRPMAEVSGVAFSTLVDSLVFRPAGMRRSARTHRRLALAADLDSAQALGYHADSSGRIVLSPPLKPQGDGAAGGVVATAMDLARFDIALTTGRLLRPESLRMMWSPGGRSSAGPPGYGLGWFLGSLDGVAARWHTGLWEGSYSALYLKLSERQLTLILLANSDGLRWEARLDEATIERSPFARALVADFAD